LSDLTDRDHVSPVCILIGRQPNFSCSCEGREEGAGAGRTDPARATARRRQVDIPIAAHDPAAATVPPSALAAPRQSLL